MTETNELLNQLIAKVDNLNKEIKEEFKETNNKIQNNNEKIIEVEKAIIGLDTKIEGIDKRLSNEETISRTALGGIFLGVALAAIKYLFFPN